MAQPFYEDQAVTGSSLENHRSRVALAMATHLSVQSALDVGCGDGRVSEQLGRVTSSQVTCVDISESAVSSCRDRGLTAHRVDIGSHPLPFADKTFDLVLMGEVLEHLVRPDLAMDEVFRVLKPNGHLILSTPNLACLPNRILLAVGVQPLFSEVGEEIVLGRWLKALGQGGHPVGHLRLYTKRGLLEFLQRRGFTVVQLRGAAFHSTGALRIIEQAIGSVTGLAMIFVALARKPS